MTYQLNKISPVLTNQTMHCQNEFFIYSPGKNMSVRDYRLQHFGSGHFRTDSIPLAVSQVFIWFTFTCYGYYTLTRAKPDRWDTEFWDQDY